MPKDSFGVAAGAADADGADLLACCAAGRTCRVETAGFLVTLRDVTRRDAVRTRRGAARERLWMRVRETRLEVFLPRTRLADGLAFFAIGKEGMNYYLKVSAEKKDEKYASQTLPEPF